MSAKCPLCGKYKSERPPHPQHDSRWDPQCLDVRESSVEESLAAREEDELLHRCHRAGGGHEASHGELKRSKSQKQSNHNHDAGGQIAWFDVKHAEGSGRGGDAFQCESKHFRGGDRQANRQHDPGAPRARLSI